MNVISSGICDVFDMIIERWYATYWETDAFGERRKFRTPLFIILGRYFRVEWYHYFAKEY